MRRGELTWSGIGAGVGCVCASFWPAVGDEVIPLTHGRISFRWVPETRSSVTSALTAAKVHIADRWMQAGCMSTLPVPMLPATADAVAAGRRVVKPGTTVVDGVI